MQAGRHELLYPEDLVGYSFIIQGEWGLEKPASSFLGVVAPQYLLKCVFKSAEGGFSNSCPWSESECRPHPISHPTTWGNSHTSTSQASPPCSSGFLSNFLSYSDPPTSPRFPSMILYWDFYNYVPTPSLSKSSLFSVYILLPWCFDGKSLFPCLLTLSSIVGS